MRTITIPLELMLSTNCNWDIDWRSQSIGDTNAASRQIVYNAFPRWIGSPQLALEGQKIAEWRAIRARAQGRRNAYRVPMIDPLSFDYGMIIKSEAERGIIPTTSNPFSGGKGYEFVPFWNVVGEPYGVFDGSGQGALPSAGAYQVWLDVANIGAVPRIGGIYSINDYPFVVTEAIALRSLVREDDYLANSGEGAEEVYRQLESIIRLTVEMPLRKAVTADDAISTIAFGIFFAEDDATGSISYGGEQYASPTLKFVEWVR
tara:strand:- start:766 stop:1548 length:783 start_codon:yes stop_codon:yes gene_type:complete